MSGVARAVAGAVVLWVCALQAGLLPSGPLVVAGTLAAAALVVVAVAVVAARPCSARTALPYLSARGVAPGETCALAQDDPDTDARPRPRAPGRGLPAVPRPA